jgi:hypothetical protein
VRASRILRSASWSIPARRLPSRRARSGCNAQLAQSRRQPTPDLGVPQFGEQAPRQQQVHHHTAGQVPDPPLDPARLLQHRAGHLERHLLRQLAQVTRREPPSGHRHDTGNGRLTQGRGSQGEACLGGQISLTEPRCPLQPHRHPPKRLAADQPAN